MLRSEFLHQMRSKAESLYDAIAPEYNVSIGLEVEPTHVTFIRKMLAEVEPPGVVLSAACGAGRYDGFLLEGGHRVVGTDQSAGMLAQARARYPQIHYVQIGLQEMAQDPAFQAAFDGAMCLDALEHVCPEDWPGIMGGLSGALRPGARLYITVDSRDAAELTAAYERARARGFPVVYGEVADQVDEAYARTVAHPQSPEDASVYHFIPAPEQVRAWADQAGLVIEEELVDPSEGYRHVLLRKG